MGLPGGSGGRSEAVVVSARAPRWSTSVEKRHLVVLFCQKEGRARGVPTYSLQTNNTLNLRARVRDECATVQASGATGYSSGTPGAQCQGHKDRTIEAVLSSGCLQDFWCNGKLQARPGPMLLLCSLSLKLVSLTGTLNFSHGLLVCLPRTHPAAQLAAGESALAPPSAPTLLNTTHVVGVATAAAAAGAAAADAEHRPRLVLLRQWLIAICSAVAGPRELGSRWPERRGGGSTC